MDEIEIIYLDMDGVLCDFHTEFKIKSGVSTVQYEAEHGTKKFWEFINDQGLSFWSEMTPMQDMEELKSFVFDNFLRIGILSSSSKKNGSVHADAGKRLWLQKYNFSSQISDNDIIIVDSAKDKQIYAKPGRILVDDYEKNINSWRAKGGIGIKHVNANKTIKELYKYV